MKNKLKYSLLIVPFFLAIFLLNKSPFIKVTKIESPKLDSTQSKKEEVELEKENLPKEFRRKIIFLTPSTGKATKFTNKQNDKWKELLEDNLLKFQEPTTKVKIVHLESLILSKYGKAKLVEKVLISYLNQNGPISSFNAYIDSQTGAIVGMPWNRTVIENKNYPKLRPTGVIKKPRPKPKKEKDSN